MEKIFDFIKIKKDYFLVGMAGALSFVFIVIIFSALGLYALEMKDNFFVRAMARVFPYPVARIERNFIFAPEYQRDINTLINFYNFEAKKGGLPAPGYDEISSSVLDRLIRNRVVEKMAEDFGIKITSKALDEKFLEMISKMGSPEEVEKNLREMYGWNEREFKKNIVRNILLQEKIKEKLEANADFDLKIEEELAKTKIRVYIGARK